jgi:hypothetical protein
MEGFYTIKHKEERLCQKLKQNGILQCLSSNSKPAHTQEIDHKGFKIPQPHTPTSSSVTASKQTGFYQPAKAVCLLAS